MKYAFSEFINSQIRVKSTIFFLARTQSERVSNPSELPFTILIAFWSFTLIFVFCMLGEIVTQQFNTFNEVLCRTDWYLLTSELKQMLVILMSIAQKPAYVHGYGNTIFTREAFKKVEQNSNIVSFVHL